MTDGPHPPYDWPDYGSTRWRAPHRPLVVLPEHLTEVTGPRLGAERVGEWDHDLTRQHEGVPLGQRIVVHGRVLDGDSRPVPATLVEVWQANAAGRYRHRGDERDSAPLDPNFSGAGRTMTDGEGRYRFVTIRPGAYPWKNHPNAWRPAHIHFSVFGVMRWSIGLRTPVWAGGSASRSRLGGRHGVSLRKSARPTPAADENVSQSPSAWATSAWRPSAQTP